MQFGSIGMMELIVIFVIALVIFGPRKLPELGRSLGKSLSEFKRASNELRSTLDEEIHLEDQRSREQTRKRAVDDTADEENHLEDQRSSEQTRKSAVDDTAEKSDSSA